MLLPSPRTSDTNGAGHHGDGGMDLRTAVSLLGQGGEALVSDGLTGGILASVDLDECAEVGGGFGAEIDGHDDSEALKFTADLAIPGADFPLLPTPAVNDMGAAYTPETWDEWTATMKAKHNNGNGHGKSLNVEAQPLRLDVERDRLLPTPTSRDWRDHETLVEDERRGKDTLARALHVELLPTPRATDGTKGGPNQRGSSGDLMLPSAVSQLLPTLTAQDCAQSGGGYNGQSNVTLTDATVRQPARWGEYEPAIRRWEAVTRPAPDPTKPNAKGNPKLSDEFDEWLMGLPAGWITDVPGVTWNEALKACGNGVVPQQAVAAVRWLRIMATWQVAA